MAAGFSREPVFWTATVPHFNDQDREIRRVAEGEELIERVPQRAHAGTSEYDNPTRLNNQRWIHVIRHDGHRSRVVITNAAGHTDTFTPYAAYIGAKADYLGWLRVDCCPVQMLAAGFDPKKLVDKSLIGQPSCVRGSFSEEQPCPHLLAEEKARQAKQAAKMEKAEKTYKSDTDKMIEANREIASKQNVAMIEALEKVLNAKSEAAEQASHPQPPRTEKAGK